MATHDSDAATSPTRPLESGKGHWLVRKLNLQCIEGPDQGAQFAARGARTVIGTHRSADLVLSDTTISRFHCEVRLGDDGAWVRDLGSKNGTWLNGIRVREALLTPKVRLTLGRDTLRLEAPEDFLKVPLSERDRFGLLLGRSRAMQLVYPMLEAAAASDVTVLLEGETGTGKDVTAHSIHLEGERKHGPFVVVDCSSIPSNLLESELFGHVKGAFTGATHDKRGAFAAASGGTLFLDELGDLPLELQPKLLRALESRRVQPVGATSEVEVDIRVIAATNRDLREEVNAARFRPDLFYRLAVLQLRLPPLRERLEDLPQLVEEFIHASNQVGTPASEALLTPHGLESLRNHGWPGNLRELRNHVERALVAPELAELAALGPQAAPGLDVNQPIRLARDQWVRYFERRYLEELLRAHGNNVSAAARAAGVDRVHLHRLLTKAGLR
ncbi:MAG: sigma 54-dependent Fis family transcriptional regulator [Archangiaceae bacterium]|nr:sigma 54-dependent Fis family transcriptional regulator [Archangiaceae bacterium]